MARYCDSCGKKMGILDDGYELPHTGLALCDDCGRKVSDLFHELYMADPGDDLEEISKKFEKKLEVTDFSDEMKSFIKKEFFLVVKERKKNDPNLPKRFSAGFGELKEIALAAGKKTGALRYTSKLTEINGIKIQTFLFFRDPILVDMPMGLTVTVAGTDREATIVAGSGGGCVSGELPEEAIEIFWNEIYKADVIITRKRIGVLGGSFDPVHIGHVALGEAAINEAYLNRLIVMPARVQPFKQDIQTADNDHRRNMLELAFAGNEKAEVSDYELTQPGISYTVRTLEHLREDHPHDEIFFVCGTDSFLEIESWYMGDEILKSFSLAVSVRPGYREEELNRKISEYEERYKTHIISIKTAMPPVSSTMVREKIRKGLPVDDMVPAEVERYITENGLYR